MAAIGLVTNPSVLVAAGMIFVAARIMWYQGLFEKTRLKRHFAGLRMTRFELAGSRIQWMFGSFMVLIASVLLLAAAAVALDIHWAAVMGVAGPAALVATGFPGHIRIARWVWRRD